jgi:beta-galactosidase/beta-glucuronidase
MKFALLLVCFFIYSVACTQTTKQVQYLSGTDNLHTRSWDFFCTGGRNSGKWTKIQVPSQWEQQGFGAYNYGRDYKTYGKNFRFNDEQGLYKYQFNVPASWKGKEIFIVFEGSMTDTEVKINGKSAGAKHQGAFYRFKYRITDKLVFGKPNLLEVTVSKMSSDESVNNAERLADYWIFGGIFRPVYLEAVPNEYIDHVSIDAKADGSFSMNVFPSNIKRSKRMVAEIIDANGKMVATTNSNIRAGDTITHLVSSVKSPLQWTAETPNLYKVNLYLKDGARTIYQASEKFGFRTIEIRKQDGIYLNGVKIKMKGVNRHVWWPETGRCVSPFFFLFDVIVIKVMIIIDVLFC